MSTINHPRFSMHASSGFTLVELIVVIVIIAVLGAVMAPRLYDTAAQSRYNQLYFLAGALSDTATMINAKAVIAGQTGPTGTVQLSDGTPVSLVYGYPAASNSGMGAALNYTGIASTIIAGTPPHWDLMVINQPYAVNRCYTVYQEASSSGPWQVYVMADVAPLAANGNPGVNQCDVNGL